MKAMRELTFGGFGTVSVATSSPLAPPESTGIEFELACGVSGDGHRPAYFTLSTQPTSPLSLDMMRHQQPHHHLNALLAHSTTGEQLKGMQVVPPEYRSPRRHLVCYSATRLYDVSETGAVSEIRTSWCVNGRDGRVAEPRFGYISAVALDECGDILVADLRAFRVYRVDRLTGAVAIVAGSGQRGFRDSVDPLSATFDGMCGLAVDAHNHIYVSDRHNRAIRHIHAPSGRVTTLGPCDAIVPYMDPTSVVCHRPTGTLYVGSLSQDAVWMHSRATGQWSRVVYFGAPSTCSDPDLADRVRQCTTARIALESDDPTAVEVARELRKTECGGQTWSSYWGGGAGRAPRSPTLVTRCRRKRREAHSLFLPFSQ